MQSSEKAVAILQYYDAPFLRRSAARRVVQSRSIGDIEQFCAPRSKRDAFDGLRIVAAMNGRVARLAPHGFEKAHVGTNTETAIEVRVIERGRAGWRS